MTKTENYNLNQWNPEDPIRRTDFNEDNVKIDAALHELEQGKAQAADLSSLQTVVSGKAQAADLAALQKTVAGKADTSTVTALQNTVAGKANTSALNALQTQVTAAQTELASKGTCTVMAGSYTGDGNRYQSINLGRAPKAVFVCTKTGQLNSSNTIYGGLAVEGFPSGAEATAVSLESTGFTVASYSAANTNASANNQSTEYHYIAFFW